MLKPWRQHHVSVKRIRNANDLHLISRSAQFFSVGLPFVSERTILRRNEQGSGLP